MRSLRDTIRRFLPVLIGCLVVFAASSAFAQSGNSPLGQILDTYQNATNTWMSQLLGYAQHLFVALAGIEVAWTAIILLLEQRELEGWVAAFLKKLMGISFFYALLLYAPTWIPAIIDSFTAIGQTVGKTGQLTPDAILASGLTLGNQVMLAGSLILSGLGIFAIGNLAWALLLGAIAVVIILCYVAIAFQFIMASIEGYIVISTGIMYLGFGGSRWTSSYVERFLGTAVSTGIRLMVIFLIIGLGQQLTYNTWMPAAQNVAIAVISLNYVGAASAAFNLTAGVIIFTALAFRLPKVVGAVISGSPSLSGSDLIGGSVLGAAATAASVIAAPELLAAKAGASAGAGASEGALSASKAAGSPMSMGGGGGSMLGSAGKNISQVSPPSGKGGNASNLPHTPSSSSTSSANRRPNAASPTSLGIGSNLSSQPLPPKTPSLAYPKSSGASNAAHNGVNGGGGSSPMTGPSLTASPSSGNVHAEADGAGVTTPSAPENGSAPLAPPPSYAESIGSTIPADVAASPVSAGDGGAQKAMHTAAKISDVLTKAQGVHQKWDDGGGIPVSAPEPEIRGD